MTNIISFWMNLYIVISKIDSQVSHPRWDIGTLRPGSFVR